MPTTFVKGDLFQDRVLAFSADISGAMDRGIAVAFRKRWPALGDALAAQKLQLGDVFAWRDGDVVVYALGIQSGDRKPKVSIVARALDAMLARAAEDGIGRIALPRIGAGKGGIDRVRVKRVLTEAGDKTPIELVVYEQFVRAPAA